MKVKSLFPLSFPVPSPGAWVGPTPESPGWALLSWDVGMGVGTRTLKECGLFSTQEHYNEQGQHG